MTTIAGAFAMALQQHRAGNLPQAEQLYRQILQIQPLHVKALNLLGVITYQTGRAAEAVEHLSLAVRMTPQVADFHGNLGNAYRTLGRVDEAMACYQRALELDPHIAETHNNLGNALRQLGRLPEAAASYQRALRLNPNLPEAHMNLGTVLVDMGQFEAAVAHHQDALRLAPNSPPVRNNLGVALRELGRHAEAVAWCRSALQINPDFAEAHVNLGAALHELGQHAEAQACCQRALQIKPHLAEAHYTLGRTHYELGDYAAAEASCRRALQIDPRYADAYCNLGVILHAQGAFDEAVACFRRALDLKPDSALAHNNLGEAFREQGKLDEAVACYRRTLDLKPDFAEAHYNLGLAFQTQGQWHAAVAYGRRALELKPDFVEAIWNRSLLRLLHGDYAGGWPDYERRWDVEPMKRERREFPQPLWNGESLAGRTILVHGEQGIGDEIMFASCLPDLRDQAARVIVACAPRLVPLFQRSFPGVDAVSSRILDDPVELLRLGRIDFQIAAGSVPRYTRSRLEDFPRRRQYLVAAAEARAQWQERLTALGPGLSVGISWRGGKLPGVIRSRSTTLEQWADVFHRPGVHFVNLQYGNVTAELEVAQRQLGVAIRHWPEIDPLQNMDAFAALIAALDLVISVDNSTVHLAGALGVPVWVALPFVPDWRWLLDREDSPWYPTIRLFRQRERGRWDDVFGRLAAALPERSGRTSVGRKSGLSNGGSEASIAPPREETR